MVGSCHRSLEDANLGKEMQVPKRYEKEYMEVRAESFSRWTPEPRDAATERKGAMASGVGESGSVRCNEIYLLPAVFAGR